MVHFKPSSTIPVVLVVPIIVLFQPNLSYTTTYAFDIHNYATPTSSSTKPLHLLQNENSITSINFDYNKNHRTNRDIKSTKIAYSSSSTVTKDNYNQLEENTKLIIQNGQSDIYLDPAGPSVELLQLGHHESLNYFRPLTTHGNETDATSNEKAENKSREFTVTRISKSPHIFLFQNLLSNEECDSLINSGQRDGGDNINDFFNNIKNVEMNDAAITEGDVNMRSNCQVGWVNNHNMIKDKDNLPLQLGRIVGNILMTNEAKMNGWCEELQLVHYDAKGGKFDLHYDGLYRSITVIYYLNGVGNTWFPFASVSGDKDNQYDNNNIISRDDAVNIVKALELKPGKHGVLAAGAGSSIWKEYYFIDHVVPVKKGDAMAFFNYKTLQQDDVNYKNDGVNVKKDWRSLHAGLPTTIDEGEKWIANHWIHHSAFREDWHVLESSIR